MRRLLLAVALACLSLVVALTAAAAPDAQEQRPVIAQPEPDAVVRGVVQVIGTAAHPQFQRYELYYAPWPVPSDSAWIFIGPDAHFQQQPLGLLGTWDSRAVPDGEYGLRIRVVKADGNYHDSDPRHIVVANVSEPATPTPEVTNTPEATPTELPTLEPSPTILVELPVGSTATPVMTTTLTPAPAVTPILSENSSGSGDAGDGEPEPSIEIVSSKRLLVSARTAAIYTIGGFIALGLFFAVKTVLVWLWHRMRP